MKRIRAFLESIAFAGLKPGGQAGPKQEFGWLGPLRGPVERLLSGTAPNDPLYLSNRTAGQKLKSWSLIGIPCLVLAAGIAVTLTNFLDPPEAKPIKEPTSAEITAKLLPNLEKDFTQTRPSDVQIIEIKVDGTRLVGVVRNTTPREIASAELVFDLTDSSGSQIGAVSGMVEKLPASGNKEFQISIKQHDAAFALVREIKTR
jgi:hypothetical protein